MAEGIGSDNLATNPFAGGGGLVILRSKLQQSTFNCMYTPQHFGSQVARLRREQDKNFIRFTMKRKMYEAMDPYAQAERAALRKRGRATYVPRPIVVARSNPGELKGMDTPLTLAAGSVLSTTNTSTGYFTVNLVRQASGSFNRVGRKIKIKSLRLTIPWKLHTNIVSGTGIIEDNILRVAVVWDKQPSGALPNYSEIFGRRVEDGTFTSQVLDNLNYDNTGRFQVLSDTKEPANMNTDGGNGVVYHGLIEKYIKVGRETVFSSTSTPMTIADISSGALYVLFRAVINVADNRFEIPIWANARLRYSDL